MRRRGSIIRKTLGITIGLIGAIIIIEFIPLKVWYALLCCLIIAFFIIFFQYLR